MSFYVSFWIPSIRYWISLSYFKDAILPVLKELIGDPMEITEAKYISCRFELKDYDLECNFFKCGIVILKITDINNSNINPKDEGLLIAKKLLKTIKKATHHIDISDLIFEPVPIEKDSFKDVLRKSIDDMFKQLVHYTQNINNKQQERLSDLAELAADNDEVDYDNKINKIISKYEIISKRKSFVSRTVMNWIMKTKLKYLLITNAIAAELHKNELKALDNMKACDFIRVSVRATICKECSFDEGKHYKSFAERTNHIKDLNSSILQQSSIIRELINYFSHVSTVTVATILAVMIPIIFGITRVFDYLGEYIKDEIYSIVALILSVIIYSILAYASYYAIFDLLESSIKKHFTTFKNDKY